MKERRDLFQLYFISYLHEDTHTSRFSWMREGPRMEKRVSCSPPVESRREDLLMEED